MCSAALPGGGSKTVSVPAAANTSVKAPSSTAPAQASSPSVGSAPVRAGATKSTTSGGLLSTGNSLLGQ